MILKRNKPFKKVAAALLPVLVWASLASWRCADGRPCPYGVPYMGKATVETLSQHCEAKAESRKASCCSEKTAHSESAPASQAPRGAECIFDTGHWLVGKTQPDIAPVLTVVAVLTEIPTLALERPPVPVDIIELKHSSPHSPPSSARAPPLD